MALSATLSVNILEYIRRSLNIHDSVCLYKRSIHRLNIMQMVAKINNSKEFHKLAFLVLTTGAISAISKIMVFINSLDNRVTLANHLRNLLTTYMKKDEVRLIQIFNSILELDIKAQYLEDFRNGDTKIWICTDITRIGVDIENIILVV